MFLRPPGSTLTATPFPDTTPFRSHAFAELRNQPRDFAARRERAFGTELIFILDDQHVGKVDRAGLYVDHDLALARGRARQFAERQRFGAAGCGRQESLHHLLLFFVVAAPARSPPGLPTAYPEIARKSVVQGRSGSVRVDLGGRRLI